MLPIWFLLFVVAAAARSWSCLDAIDEWDRSETIVSSDQCASLKWAMKGEHAKTELQDFENAMIYYRTALDLLTGDSLCSQKPEPGTDAILDSVDTSNFADPLSDRRDCLLFKFYLSVHYGDMLSLTGKHEGAKESYRTALEIAAIVVNHLESLARKESYDDITHQLDKSIDGNVDANADDIIAIEVLLFQQELSRLRAVVGDLLLINFDDTCGSLKMYRESLQSLKVYCDFSPVWKYTTALGHHQSICCGSGHQCYQMCDCSVSDAWGNNIWRLELAETTSHANTSTNWEGILNSIQIIASQVELPSGEMKHATVCRNLNTLAVKPIGVLHDERPFVNLFRSLLGKSSVTMDFDSSSLSLLYWSMFMAGNHAQLTQSAFQYLEHARALDLESLRNRNVFNDYLSKERQHQLIVQTFRDGFWPKDLGSCEGSHCVGSSTRTPVFIVGFFRSGSSILESMLSRHPNIVGLGEENVFSMAGPIESESNGKPISKDTQRSGLNDMDSEREDALNGYGPEGVSGINSFASLSKNHIRGMANRIECSMLKMAERLNARRYGRNNSLNHTSPSSTSTKKDISRVITKMLNNYKHIGFIHLLFPNAIILHATRDPMDTLFSCFKTKFVQDDSAVWSLDMQSLVAEYVLYLRTMQHYRSQLPGSIIDVSYEALVAAPEATMRAIVVDHLGLPWDKVVLEPRPTGLQDEITNTASIFQVRQKIYLSSVGAWLRYNASLSQMTALLQQQLELYNVTLSQNIATVISTCAPDSTRDPGAHRHSSSNLEVETNWRISPTFDYVDFVNRVRTEVQEMSKDCLSIHDTSNGMSSIAASDSEQIESIIEFNSTELWDIMMQVYEINTIERLLKMKPHQFQLKYQSAVFMLHENKKLFTFSCLNQGQHNQGVEGNPPNHHHNRERHRDNELQSELESESENELGSEHESENENENEKTKSFTSQFASKKTKTRKMQWNEVENWRHKYCWEAYGYEYGDEGKVTLARIQKMIQSVTEAADPALVVGQDSVLSVSQQKAAMSVLVASLQLLLRNSIATYEAIINIREAVSLLTSIEEQRSPAPLIQPSNLDEYIVTEKEWKMSENCYHQRLSVTTTLRSSSKCTRYAAGELPFYYFLLGFALSQSLNLPAFEPKIYLNDVSPAQTRSKYHVSLENDVHNEIALFFKESFLWEPYDLSALSSYVHSIVSMPDFEKRLAIKLLREVTNIVPAIGNSLTQLTPETFAWSPENGIQQPLADVETGSSKRAGIALQLMAESGLYWHLHVIAERADNIQVAWKHIQLAHKLDAYKLNASSYTTKASVDRGEEYKNIYRNGFWPHHNSEDQQSEGSLETIKDLEPIASNSTVPVFIVGFHRSGSNLLQSLLCFHANIHCLASAHSNSLASRADRITESRSTIRTQNSFISETVISQQLDVMHREIQKISKLLRKSGNVSVAYRRLQSMGSSLLNSLQRSIAIDRFSHPQQSPYNIAIQFPDASYHIGLIHLLFPNALILHTMRDPMDTIVSSYRTKHQLSATVWSLDMQTLVAEYVLNLRTMQHYRSQLPGRIIDVSYEALVAAPEATMRAIVVDHLGLHWDAAILQALRRDNLGRRRSRNSRRGKGSVGRWKVYSSSLATVAKLVDQKMKSLGVRRGQQDEETLHAFPPVGDSSRIRTTINKFTFPARLNSTGCHSVSARSSRFIEQNWLLSHDFDYDLMMESLSESR